MALPVHFLFHIFVFVESIFQSSCNLGIVFTLSIQADSVDPDHLPQNETSHIWVYTVCHSSINI